MKVLVTNDTFCPSIDGPTFLPANSFADAEAIHAHALVAAGKGLYVDKKDDPTRTKQLTASAELVKLVSDAQGKGKTKAADKAPPAEA